jgi:hypothetical protein
VDYVIKNYKNVYIKLNSQGRAETCSNSDKQLFEFHKAKNICDCLPKTLKKMNFKVEAVPEIKPIDKDLKEKEKEKEKNSKENKHITLNSDDYELSENITRWVDKFGACADSLDEARKRKEQLRTELNNIDKEFLNILHIIELEKSKDLYGGWLQYKNIKENRKKRREIKDELLIISNVLSRINSTYLERDTVRKSVNGLLNREYSFRVVESEEEERSVV